MDSSREITENCNHVWSISLPSKSHPLALKVEEGINKLKTLERSSTASMTTEAICNRLDGVRDLYGCVDDLLHLPLIPLGLINHPYAKLVNEASDGLVRLLDMCGMAREILTSMKEHVQELQVSLCKRGQEPSMESKIEKYIRDRKKVKKDINKCLRQMKPSESKCASSPLVSDDPLMLMVITALREISLITMSVLQAILFRKSASGPKPKGGKWSLVSKLVRKGRVTCEGEEHHANDIESLDAALFRLCGCAVNKDNKIDRTQMVNKRLEASEIAFEDVEAGLNCMFRNLIQTRVSLLNILTH